MVTWCQKPVIPHGGVVNAASYTTTPDASGPVGRGLAPGSIVSIFGEHLAASTQAADTIPLPTQLGGTSVTVSGVPAPLFYVSPSQINFQMPWQGSLPRSIVVSTGEGASDPYLLDAVHGFYTFTRDASGCGQGAVLNQGRDGMLSPNSPSNSASPGDYLAVFGTGLAPVLNQPPDGNPAPLSPLARYLGGAGPSFDFIADGSAPLWAGLAPGLIGVAQFNIRIPDTVREGCAVPLHVDLDGSGNSQPVTVSIRRGGGTCVDPPPAGYGQVNWEKTVTTAPVGTTTETDVATVSLQSSPGKQAPPPPNYLENAGRTDILRFSPSCPIPGYRSLDAGVVTVQGPGFGPAQASIVPMTTGQVSGLTLYRAVLPNGSIQPGSFSVAASGGADVSGFQSGVQIGSEIHVTTPLAGRVFSSRQPFTVNWTGGDPNTWVTLKSVRHFGSYEGSTYYQARASARTITVPITSLGFVVFGPGPSEIVLEVTPDPSEIAGFSAAGLSLGGQHSWKYTYRFEGILFQ